MEILEIILKTYDTLALAKRLLGCTLVHTVKGVQLAGTIVETEAYLCDDPGCHAFRGRTPRNETMFAHAGTIYIYQIYGVYHCFNIVSNKQDVGEAVLIRAIEPLAGIDLMIQNRQAATRGKIKNFTTQQLCNGPSKLVQAMAFDKSQNGMLLGNSSIDVELAPPQTNIVTTTRIGLGKGKGEHLPYRFYLKNNAYISKK